MPTMTPSKGYEAELHASPSNDVIDRTEEPPPLYTRKIDRQSNIAVPPHICAIDYSAYCIPGSTLSDDQTTRKFELQDSESAGNMKDLESLLEKQLSLPPRPIVTIRGTHLDKVYSWGATRTDFDLALDLTPLIMPMGGTNLLSRNILNFTGLSDDQSLKNWVRLFYERQEESLTLERIVTNWDTSFLERVIRDLVFSTNYKGNIEVAFPVQQSRLTIVRPGLGAATGPASSASSSRKWYSRNKTSGESSSFKQTVQFRTCQIQTVWPYASSPPAAVSTTSNATFHPSTIRNFAVQSESAWFESWKESIRNAVIARRQGWVTIEDWKDAYMGNVHWPDPTKDWGTTTEDWTTFMRGIKIRGADKAAPGDITKYMYLASGVVK